jgi:chorismate mutase
LTVISEARVNIKVEEAPKIVIAEVIPKVLREVHAEAIEVSLRKKVIPKTFSSIAPRDARSITDQGIGPRTT